MMRVGLITFLIIASIILTSNQIQPAFAQSFFDDLTNIFTNLQSYFDDIFNNSPNNGQNIDVFRALGETISDWTDDFDEEKKLLKEQKIQNEIELEKRKNELEQRERQLQTETLAKEQKQRELEEQQRLLDAERLAKEQKQRELEDKQRLLDAERLAKEQKQRELEDKQRLLDAERLAKEQKQRELEDRQRLLDAERLAKEQKQRELEEQQRRQEVERLQQEKARIIQESNTNPVIKGIIDGKIKFYIEPIPYYYKVAGIDTAVNNIADSLESRTVYGATFERSYNQYEYDIKIEWVKNYGTGQGGVAIFKTIIQVALGDDNCWSKWQPFDTWTVKKIMWHEIGHTLGYQHSNDFNNIMYSSVGHKKVVDVKHYFTLKAGYSQWWSFCNVGEISWTAKSHKNTDGFNAFAIPSDDPRRFSKDGGVVYFTTNGESCGSNNKISITRYCAVGNGAYLHFKNNENHPIDISFEMYDRNPGKSPNMTWDRNFFYYDSKYLNYVWNLFH